VYRYPPPANDYHLCKNESDIFTRYGTKNNSVVISMDYLYLKVITSAPPMPVVIEIGLKII
jgi:hypothetical protein